MFWMPFKIDFSIGNLITPHEIKYKYRLMLESRSIDIMTYNLETVLAEKLETIFNRVSLNTRMRDFYDIHILLKLHEDDISHNDLHDAFLVTMNKRDSLIKSETGPVLLNEIRLNSNLQNLWESYKKQFPYAAEISWDKVMDSVMELYSLTDF